VCTCAPLSCTWSAARLKAALTPKIALAPFAWRGVLEQPGLLIEAVTSSSLARPQHRSTGALQIKLPQRCKAVGRVKHKTVTLSAYSALRAQPAAPRGSGIWIHAAAHAVASTCRLRRQRRERTATGPQSHSHCRTRAAAPLAGRLLPHRPGQLARARQRRGDAGAVRRGRVCEREGGSELGCASCRPD